MKFGYSEFTFEYLCDICGYWVYVSKDGDMVEAWYLQTPTKTYTEPFTQIVFANIEELIEYAYEHRKEGER